MDGGPAAAGRQPCRCEGRRGMEEDDAIAAATQDGRETLTYSGYVMERDNMESR